MTTKEMALICKLPYAIPQFFPSDITEAQEEVYDLYSKMMETVENSWQAVRITSLYHQPVSSPNVDSVTGYLRALRRTLTITLIGMLVGTAIAITSVSALVIFLTSESAFMHPYLALFLSLGSVILIGHSLMSAATVKKRIESILWVIIRNCSER